MNSEKFAERNLEHLINSPELKDLFFDSETGEKIDTPEARAMYATLKDKVTESYDTHARRYHEERKFVSKYVSFGLRSLGTGLDFLGDILYLPTGGATLSVTKLPAFIAKGMADTIDGIHYLTHSDYGSVGDKTKDLAKIIGETAVERVISYLPSYGIGSGIDALRGRTKFDNRVKDYTLDKAKEAFLKEQVSDNVVQLSERRPEIIGQQYFERNADLEAQIEPKGGIIPLSNFQREGYAQAA